MNLTELERLAREDDESRPVEFYQAEMRVAAFSELKPEQGRALYAQYVKRGLKIDELISALKTAREKQDSLFDKIKHGDHEHQAWLKAALEEHFHATLSSVCEGKKEKV